MLPVKTFLHASMVTKEERIGVKNNCMAAVICQTKIRLMSKQENSKTDSKITKKTKVFTEICRPGCPLNNMHFDL